MAERRQTALGVARARFVEGLPRKAREVRASLALLTGTPDEERPREELRRRLHALYASAQVFRIEPLAAALKEALADIDEVEGSRSGFSQAQLDALAKLAAKLPELADIDVGSTPSVIGLKAPPPPPPPTRTVQPALSVLVVDGPDSQARVRAALEPERYEVLVASDVDEALRVARSAAPDLVLADRDLASAPGADLIARLHEDPLTDFVPVVLLVPPGSPIDRIAMRSQGAEDALAKPLDAAAVRRTVERVIATLGGPAGASTLTGDLTVEELADRLAEEVKRGIVEAAEKGRDVSVPVGDGTTLLAAAWSAIGKVRAHIAERSGGRVRFREGSARGGPAFVTVVGEEVIEDETLPEDFTLAGRSVLVCDDDPAVVWFFAALFREHGAEVVEAADGMEALEAARRRRPDLVVSDILMPRLDGFGLTRALKRDPILADVPVILLSWKEDFLQRMRELKAGASGYLRKEAAATQILAAVRDVLRPRTALESRLRAGGDVRGRLEDVGAQTLLTTVAALRPDARLSIRDASSLYEAELRAGAVVDVTRTATDGTFARGPRVLETLLGATTGRYTIADAEGPVRRSIDAPLATLIDAGMRAIAARVAALSIKNLAHVERVELDEALLRAVVQSSPEEVQRIASHLERGLPPGALLDELDPQMVDGVLASLARQGAIRGVFGPDGEDRVALARQARDERVEQNPPTLFPSAPPEPLDDADLESLRPPAMEGPAPRPLEALEPPAAIPSLDEPFGDEPASVPPPPPHGSAATHPGADGRDVAGRAHDAAEHPHDRARSLHDGVRGDAENVDGDADAASGDAENVDGDADAASAEAENVDGDADAASADAQAASAGAEAASGDAQAASGDAQAASAGAQAASAVAEAASAEADAASAGAQAASADAEAASGEADAASAGAQAASADAEAASGDAQAASGDAQAASGDADAASAEAQAASADAEAASAVAEVADGPETRRDAGRGHPAGAYATDADATLRDAAPPSMPPAEPGSERADPEKAGSAEAPRSLAWLGWVLAAAVLGAIGVVAWQLGTSPSASEDIGPVPPVAHTLPSSPAPDEPAPNAPPPDEPETDAPEPTESPAPSPPAYGREEAGIADLGVTVAPDQGLLVLEPGPAPQRVVVGASALEVADEPVGVALSPGVHHLTFHRGDHQDFVWVAVRAGHTRRVPPLP